MIHWDKLTSSQGGKSWRARLCVEYVSWLTAGSGHCD